MGWAQKQMLKYSSSATGVQSAITGVICVSSMPSRSIPLLASSTQITRDAWPKENVNIYYVMPMSSRGRFGHTVIVVFFISSFFFNNLSFPQQPYYFQCSSGLWKSPHRKHHTSWTTASLSPHMTCEENLRSVYSFFNYQHATNALLCLRSVNICL